MKQHRLSLTLTAALLTLLIASSSFGDISNTAVPFLRIAPGSRAAGMGEAFVAIADDASATHWNPAGLGSAPLAQTWLNARVPARHGSLGAIAALKTGKGSSYLAYDIWGISDKGLVRFDNEGWNTSEIFHTRTDETIEMKVREYFGVTDDARLAGMVEKVAAANNRGTYDELVEIRDQVTANVPDDYDDLVSLRAGLDSLVAGYTLCLVKWEQVDKIREYLSEGLKDSVLATNEIERILFSVEKSVSRFIPEDITIPYNAVVTGELTSIASGGELLLIGTTDGLLEYNGVKWRWFNVEGSLPSNFVTCLYNIGSRTLIGTDNGVVVHNGLTVSTLRPSRQSTLSTDSLSLAGTDSTDIVIDTDYRDLPTGRVEAIGAFSASDIYAVVNHDLYHYDGQNWSNNMPYTVVIDDTPEAIAEKFSIYGSTVDREKYLAKFHQINSPEVSDSLTQSRTVLVPGSEIRVPFLGEIKGEVRSIFPRVGGTLWLGTDHGVLILGSDKWELPGYVRHEVVEGQTIAEFLSLDLPAVDESTPAMDESTPVSDESTLTVDESPLPTDSVAVADTTQPAPDSEYRAAIEQFKQLNDLTGDVLAVGEKVWKETNPAASPVLKIDGNGQVVYVATTGGLLEYSEDVWSRAGIKDLGHHPMVDICYLKSEIWFASKNRVVTRGKGRTEFSLMHVKWLPELADDLYYEFLSFVRSTETWGTFGGNITFLSYGQLERTDESGTSLGTWDAFEIAFTGSYGTSLRDNLAGGISAKVIYSRLSELGTAKEKGDGISTTFAVDLGILYQMSSRLTWGVALSNLGPKMSYVDVAQADDLPRNLAIGFAYKPLQSEYNRLLFTAEVNKILVGLDDGLGEELRQLVVNGGAEFTYANMFAVRAGYIFDEEGQIKTMTLGAGVALMNRFKFDFAYIPSDDAVALANTLRMSLSILP